MAHDAFEDGVLASTMTDKHGMFLVFRRLGFALSVDGNEVRAELDVRRQ
jgi:hypothetical protein